MPVPGAKVNIRDPTPRSTAAALPDISQVCFDIKKSLLCAVFKSYGIVVWVVTYHIKNYRK